MMSINYTATSKVHGKREDAKRIFHDRRPQDTVEMLVIFQRGLIKDEQNLR